MCKKKYIHVIFLSIICLFCLIMGMFATFVTSPAFAMEEPVIIQEHINESGLSSDFWLADDNGDDFRFESQEKDYESTVTTKSALNGSYSVSFSVPVHNGANGDKVQMLVALGAQEKEKISINYTDAYCGTKNDDALYLAFTGKRIYVFDRNHGDGQPDYENLDGRNGKDDLGTPYWKHLYSIWDHKNLTTSRAKIKLEVVHGTEKDVLNIYLSSTSIFSTVPACSVELHKQGVANGYLQFSQALASYEQGVINSCGISGLRIDDAVLYEDDLEILGEKGLVTFIGAKESILYDDKIHSKIISNFNLTDNGFEDGVEVFELTFTSERFATPETLAHAWGLVLGVDKSGDLSTGTKIRFVGTGILKLGSDTEKASGRCGKLCDNNTSNLPNTVTTYTVTGYAGGRVEIQYSSVGCLSTCTGHTATFENVDFDGRIAFQIFNDSGLDGGYWKVTNVSINSVVDVEKNLELKIENQDNAILIVGDTVKLSTNMDCKLEIVQGSEVATLEGDELTALSVGEVVVKATLLEDDSISATYTIEVEDGENYTYAYSNKFNGVQDITSGENACDFSVVNTETGVIGVNDALYFENTVGETPAQVCLAAPFTHDYQNEIVFDVTFTVTVDNTKPSGPNKNYTFGFAFGLDEIGSEPLSQGAGAILINCSKAEVYNNGQKVEATYVTKNQPGATTQYEKDTFGMFANSTCPLTVRLVAKSDGTLEYYRGIVYKSSGKADVGTYLSDLFATYSGFDFNGYVSMFTNVTALDQYEKDETQQFLNDDYVVKFDNLIVKGNFRINDSVESEVVDLGVASVVDLLHTELPIELDYYVYTRPNLDIYHGYKVEVLSGPATLDDENRLVTTGAGTIKLKITSDVDSTKFKEVEFTIGELIIESIAVDTSLFADLTNDSQAFFIDARLNGENTYITEYLTIDYEVLEGPVSIIDGYLYINGTGKAKIRVYSHYLPSVEQIVEFEIKDGDLQYQNVQGNGCSCASSIAESLAFPFLVVAMACCVILLRKSKKGSE